MPRVRLNVMVETAVFTSDGQTRVLTLTQIPTTRPSKTMTCQQGTRKWPEAWLVSNKKSEPFPVVS